MAALEEKHSPVSEDSPTRYSHRASTVPSSDSDDEDHSDLVISQTNRTNRSVERVYVPINPGDRAELTRLASNFTEPSLVRTRSRAASDAGPGGLHRSDTLYGVGLGDAVLDPKSPEFDAYKWSRMSVDPEISNL